MVDVTITIPNDKVDAFREAFLKVYPKPAGYTDLQWFKKKVRDWCLRVYKSGVKQAWQEANEAIYDNDVVDDVPQDQ